MSALFVGIDVSKAQLDVCILDGSTAVFPNTSDGLLALVERLKSQPRERIVIEATGGYERLLVASLMDAQLPVVVVNPKQTRDFAKAAGKLAKTDRLDAEVLARFGQAMQPGLRPLPDEAARKLHEILARRAQLLGIRTAESNRLKQAHVPLVCDDLEASIAFLDQRLKALDEQLDQFIRESPAWQDKVELLKTVPGVGQQTARTLVAELPELGHCSRQAIAALVGVAPMNRDSGLLRGQRIIVGGRARVRSALYMATLSASRCTPPIRDYYQRLLKAGKPKNSPSSPASENYSPSSTHSSETNNPGATLL